MSSGLARVCLGWLAVSWALGCSEELGGGEVQSSDEVVAGPDADGGQVAPLLALPLDKSWAYAGDDVALTVQLNGVTLAMDGSARGHLHVHWNRIDSEPLLMTDQSSFGLSVPAGASVGEHQFIVALVDNDHQAWSPPVEVSIPLTVRESTSGPWLDATAAPWGAAGDKIVVTVDVGNFILDINGAGDGHYHVYWNSRDQQPLAMSAESQVEVTIPELATPGEHALIVALVDNDHQSLSLAAQKSLPFEVRAVASRSNSDNRGYSGSD